jgi:hypothetical protein
MWRRTASVLAGLLLGGACVGLGIFLHHEGIVLAGAWAGVIGLLGIPVGALGVWLAWPRGEEPARLSEQEPLTSIQYNESSGHGTIFAVQNGKQVIYPDQSSRDASIAKERHSDEEIDRNSS